jgi:hypothetical protein
LARTSKIFWALLFSEQKILFQARISLKLKRDRIFNKINRTADKRVSRKGKETDSSSNSLKRMDNFKGKVEMEKKEEMGT